MRKFLTVLQGFLHTRQWLYTAVSRTRPSPFTPQQEKSHRRTLRKLEKAEQVRSLLESLQQEGREMIWTYGSSDGPQVDGPWVGEFGMYFPSPRQMNVSEFLPVGEMQTMGRAKVSASTGHSMK